MVANPRYNINFKKSHKINCVGGGKMKFNEYCPLKKLNISEAECIEIISELCELKTEEHIKAIRKRFELSNKEMLKVCEGCPNYEKS
jgi:predicted DNA-binding antitoxin AbrB/MazE fold protein